MISIARNEAESGPSDRGAAGEVLAQAQAYLSQAGEVVKDVVNQRPALALGLALATGVLLGWLIKRR